MKIIKYSVGTVVMIFLLIALLIGIIECTIFGGRSFYRYQYEKLEVTKDVQMEIDDLMEVTDEMLLYLQGKREDLVVVTTIAGQEREFFNTREKLHMEDVKGLNLASVRVGWVCLLLFFVFGVPFTLWMVHDYRKADADAKKATLAAHLLKIYRRTFIFAILLLLLVVGIGAMIVASDFTHYWTLFHEIVFTNDLWLLDPNTDLLINIVPEDFFIALVARCAIRYAIALAVLAALIIGGYFLFRKGTKKASQAVAVLLAIALAMTLPATVYAGENDASYREAQEILEKIPTSAPWPEAPELTSHSAILIEENTGNILLAKNALDAQEPADLNKLMTAYLTLTRAGDTARTDIVTYPQSVIYSVQKGDTHIGLKINEVLTVYDSLCGLLLPSADDCAAGLAHFVNAKNEDFVSAMNMSAMLMNFANTHYKKAGGRPVEGQYSCAYDVARLYEELLTYPIFVEISRKTTYTIEPTNITQEKRPMKNKHRMLFKDDKYYDTRVVCGKNGRGDGTDNSLVTFARSGDISLVCVVMGADAEGQYADTKKLLDYGFNEFENVNISANDSRFYQSSGDAGILTAGSQLSFYRFDAKASLLLPKNTSINDLTTTVIRSMDSSFSMIRYYIGDYYLGEAQILEATQKLADVSSPLFKENGGMLPYKSLPPMEKPGEGLPWYLLPAIAAGVLLIIIFICGYNSKANKRRRRHRRTKIVKNMM
ncbi:MAG: TIGR01906 family membrane protein [Lachnospiraceae bacterium]|nr:TIGR01906 family membrane protein [Lachnospiraceae bacterium]